LNLPPSGERFETYLMPKAKSKDRTRVVEVVALSGFDKALAYAVPPYLCGFGPNRITGADSLAPT
jgi:hypothetical protein